MCFDVGLWPVFSDVATEQSPGQHCQASFQLPETSSPVCSEQSNPLQAGSNDGALFPR